MILSQAYVMLPGIAGTPVLLMASSSPLAWEVALCTRIERATSPLMGLCRVDVCGGQVDGAHLFRGLDPNPARVAQSSGGRAKALRGLSA